jgi:hypothetical protein
VKRVHDLGQGVMFGVLCGVCCVLSVSAQPVLIAGSGQHMQQRRWAMRGVVELASQQL